MTYGADGQAYPVARGDVWRCGDHTFHCGDLRNWEAPAHDLIYSDPPWGKALLTHFHKTAGLPPPEHTWQDLYAAIIQRAEVPMWLECGDREIEEVFSMLPGPYCDRFSITYGHGRPCALLYSGRDDSPVEVPEGMSDEQTPLLVLSGYRLPSHPAVVYDPCAGQGLTSRCAEMSGWHSVNNELNPLRVSSALARMHRLTKLEPRRV